MSAYVVEDATINRIVSVLNGWSREGAYSMNHPNLTHREYPRLNVLAHNPEALANAMRRINEAAVRDRYEDADESGMIPPPIEFQNTGPCALVPLIKALACFLYQCSEGDCPDRALYAELDRLRAECASDVVRALPEYEAAPWG